jgi:hypothetical protein
MPRTIILCSGIFLLSATNVSAQNLPKNPTPQQVVGYRMVELQQWNSQQLPMNSVLYKTGWNYAGWQSLQFNFKKQKQPMIDLSSIRSVGLPGNAMNSASQQLPFLRANLFHQKELYRQWRKESWFERYSGEHVVKRFPDAV